jgi:hypothetical protein
MQYPLHSFHLNRTCLFGTCQQSIFDFAIQSTCRNVTIFSSRVWRKPRLARHYQHASPCYRPKYQLLYISPRLTRSTREKTRLQLLQFPHGGRRALPRDWYWIYFDVSPRNTYDTDCSSDARGVYPIIWVAWLLLRGAKFTTKLGTMAKPTKMNNPPPGILRAYAHMYYAYILLGSHENYRGCRRGVFGTHPIFQKSMRRPT